MQLSRRSWQAVALVLFLIAISWGVCGLLLGVVPTKPTESMPNPESTTFWITRGCCLGPAFSLAFLAYMALMVGRRQRHATSCAELVAALGVVFGLIPILLGLAIALQPEPEVDDRIFTPLLCILPGLSILGLSSIVWALVLRRDRIQEL